jgi:hypothetical protein
MRKRVHLTLAAAMLLAWSLSACQGSVSFPAPSSSSTPGPAPEGSPTASPTPEGSSTPSPVPADAGGEGEGGGEEGDPIGGVPEIGPLGDPCKLLSRDDVEDALGVKVLAIARGKLGADEGQMCAYAVDAPGVTSGLPPNLGLDPSEGTLGPFMVAFEEAGKGGAFGVHLGVVDPNDIDSGPGDDEPDPNVTITKVDVGFDGVVVTTPNGGSAFTWDGIRVQILLMDLITGTPDADALTDLLRTAYGQL